MKMKEVRELSAGQLQQQVAEVQRELREVREAVRIGKEKNTRRIRALRREAARILGALQERRPAQHVPRSI